GLTPDGRRILAGPHNRVPLRPSRKRVGHGPFYDLLQSHASSPPGSVSPTPISSSSSRSSRILTASAFPTAHRRRRARSLASSGVMIVSAGPSADTTMRTWPLCVGCTTKLVSYTLVTAPHTVSLDAKFSGKGPGFCVLRVSLQCLTDTRQMHVGVPLYREHKVLVHLVAVPAAAIMWCNLVVPAQFLQAVRCQVSHHASPRTLARTSRNQASANSSSAQQLGSSSASRVVAARYLVAASMSSRTTPASRASVGMPASSQAFQQAAMRRRSSGSIGRIEAWRRITRPPFCTNLSI